MARGVTRAQGGGTPGDFRQADQQASAGGHRTPSRDSDSRALGAVLPCWPRNSHGYWPADRTPGRALVLNKIPGYTTLHGFAARLSDSDEGGSFQPALVEIEEALVPGFEQHSGNRSTVFIPSVPTPMAGAVYIIDNSRVHLLDLPAVSVMQCIPKWGGGSDKLLAAFDAACATATSSLKRLTKNNKIQQDQDL